MPWERNGVGNGWRTLRHSFWGQLVPPLAGIMLICIGLVATINYWQDIRHIEESTATHLHSLSRVFAGEINSWLERREAETSLVARNPLIYHDAADAAAGRPVQGGGRTALADLVELRKAYEDVYVVDPAGMILLSASGRDGSTRPVDDLITTPLTTGSAFISDAYISTFTGRASIAIGVPVRDPVNDRPVFVLVARVAIEEVLSPLGDYQREIGDTGEVVLVDERGVAITDLRRAQESPLSCVIEMETISLALRGLDGVVTGEPDYAGYEVIKGYAPIPHNGWALVVKQDTAEVLGPERADTLRSLALNLITLALVWLACIIIVRKVIRPLQRVTIAVQHVAQGVLDHRVDEEQGPSEIKLLAKAFNDTTTALQRQVRSRELTEGLLRAVATNNKVSTILDETIGILLEGSGFSVGAFYLYDEEKDRLILRAARGVAEEFHTRSVTMGDGLIGQAAVEKRPLILRDVPADTPYVVRSLPGDLKPRCLVHLPVFLPDRLLGVLVLAGLHDVDDADIERLTTAISLLDIGLSNALAYEEIVNLSGRLQGANQVLESQNEELQVQSEELRVQAEELAGQGRELERRNRELAHATQMKSEFMARMSHELRTPLNAIMGFAQMLLHPGVGTLNAKQAEYVQDIHTAGEHLLYLINDILDLAKIEAGKIVLVPQEIDPVAPLTEAINIVDSEAQAKEITLVSEIPVGRFKVWADADRLRQVFVNLLSNGVKFTPSGGRVTITVTEHADQVQFAVADTGIGIPDDKREEIFEEFKQVDASASRQFGGTGLGLAITKRLIELHGGHIFVSSKLGGGSTFTFFLPTLRQDLKQAEGTLCKVQGTRETKSRQVVLVSRDSRVVNYLSNLLTTEGYLVTPALCAIDGLRVIRERTADLVILEPDLLDMSCVELVKTLRRETGTRDIPVVVLLERELDEDEHDLLTSRQTFLWGKGRMMEKEFLMRLKVIVDEDREIKGTEGNSEPQDPNY